MLDDQVVQLEITVGESCVRERPNGSPDLRASGAGSLLVLIPVYLGRCFDRRVIGRASGLYIPLGMPFTLAAAPVVGYFGQLTGGFRAPFMGLAGVLVVAALLLFLIRESAPGAARY